jgi:FtsH-binding integral membrane protein
VRLSNNEADAGGRALAREGVAASVDRLRTSIMLRALWFDRQRVVGPAAAGTGRHLQLMNAPETYTQSIPVIQLGAQSRGRFISRTYNHLFSAIVAFTLIEIALFKSGLAEPMAKAMLGTSWLLVLGGFVLVSWLARGVAHRAGSKPAQYAALAGYVMAQAVIFVPLLYIANAYAPGAISSAAGITLAAFTALTLVAFWTRKDFSFLRGILMWGGIVALALIVGGAIFGFNLGTYFSVAMVGLAGAAILYDTSNVIHHYPEDRYVAAALELFASVALMLWYVLRLVMDRR